jgi:hypothetical protein
MYLRCLKLFRQTRQHFLKLLSAEVKQKFKQYILQFTNLVGKIQKKCRDIFKTAERKHDKSGVGVDGQTISTQ